MFGRSVRANDAERTRKLPGDDLVPNLLGSITHAITIRSSRQDVWPWLAQMGAGRAGWYSYDFIDNGGHRSAERILPELQSIEVGTLFPAIPGATDCFFVLHYEPERSLVLGWLPESKAAPVTTWSLVLEEREPGCTRLIERGRVCSPYRPLGLRSGSPDDLVRWLTPSWCASTCWALRGEQRQTWPHNKALHRTFCRSSFSVTCKSSWRQKAGELMAVRGAADKAANLER